MNILTKFSDWMEKAKVAYHEHDGWPLHPVAVKHHEEYFAGKPGEQKAKVKKLFWLTVFNDFWSQEVENIREENFLINHFADTIKKWDKKDVEKALNYTYNQAAPELSSSDRERLMRLGTMLRIRLTFLQAIESVAPIVQNLFPDGLNINHNSIKLRKELVNLQQKVGISVLKEQVTSKISDVSGISYDRVNSFIKQWAKSSGGNHRKSIAIQHMAKGLFNLDEAVTDHLGKGKAPVIDEEVIQESQALLQTQYDLTQKYLKEKGIDSLTIFRGISGIKNLRSGRMKNISLQPLSSFSVSAKIAADFTHLPDKLYATVLMAEIPREQIFSIPTTGFGCLDEKEVVILGKPTEFKVFGDDKFLMDDVGIYLSQLEAQNG